MATIGYGQHRDLGDRPTPRPAATSADRWTSATLQQTGGTHAHREPQLRRRRPALHPVGRRLHLWQLGHLHLRPRHRPASTRSACRLPSALGGTVTRGHSSSLSPTMPTSASATATVNGVAGSYTFDTLGNLKVDQEGSTTTNFTYNSANQLTQSVIGATTTVYGWDTTNAWRTSQGPSGNPTQIQYAYNAQGRMASYANSATGDLRHLHLRCRRPAHQSAVTVSGGTTTTNWVYDGHHPDEPHGVSRARAPGESTTSTTRTAPLSAASTARRRPAPRPIYFTMITNSRGDVCRAARRQRQRLRRLPLRRLGSASGRGQLRDRHLDAASTSLISSTLAGQIASRQVLRYAGYVYDPESGLYYCSARYYDPATRQWTTADSAKADGEESPYQYCSGHPTDQSDPSGEGSVKIDFPRPKHLGKYNWSGYYTLVCGVDAAFAQDHLLDQLAADPILGFARTLDWWAFHMVAGKNPWDFKLAARGGAHGWRDKKYLPFHGKRISPDDFGNIHFGYTGSAIGLNKLELDLGAQGANFFTNTLKDLNWNHPKIKAAIETIKSEFKSDGMIALGVRLFHRYGPMTGTGIHFVRS